MAELILIKKHSYLWEGYECCKVVYFDGVIRTIKYHKYIWESVNGPIPSGYEIHHKDENKLNNSLDNLECLTKSDHACRHSDKLIKFNSKSYKEKYTTKICEWCKKEFEQRISISRKALKKNPNKKDFCSNGCTSKHTKSQPLVHGTYRGYCWYKCRCTLCVEAFTDKMKTWKRWIKQ